MNARVPAVEATQLTLGPDDDGREVTTEEFAEARYIEPYKYELVDGRLLVMPPDGDGHQSTSMPLRDHLGAYRLARPDFVQAVYSNPWVRVSERTNRIGDVGVYLARPDGSFDYPDQPPDLIFEVVSPSASVKRRDYVQKRAEYQALGIPEYVILDRFKAEAVVLTLVDGVYEQSVLRAADTYETPRLPGFALRLAEVLGG